MQKDYNDVVINEIKKENKQKRETKKHIKTISNFSPDLANPLHPKNRINLHITNNFKKLSREINAINGGDTHGERSISYITNSCIPLLRDAVNKLHGVKVSFHFTIQILHLYSDTLKLFPVVVKAKNILNINQVYNEKKCDWICSVIYSWS